MHYLKASELYPANTELIKIKWGEIEDKITDWEWTGNAGSKESRSCGYCTEAWSSRQTAKGNQDELHMLRSGFFLSVDNVLVTAFRHWSCIISWKFLGACVVIFSSSFQRKERVRTKESHKLSRVKGKIWTWKLMLSLSLLYIPNSPAECVSIKCFHYKG